MAKEKTFLQCVVSMKDGRSFENPLMLSEAHLISTLAKLHEKVVVTAVKCDPDKYKRIFNR